MSELEFLHGQTVEEIRVGSGFRVVFEIGEHAAPAAYLDVGSFSYVDPDGDAHTLDEAAPEGLGPALALIGKRVVAADSTAGVLDVSFDDRSRLRCEPDEDVEAWEVRAARRVVICTPGGELAMWDG